MTARWAWRIVTAPGAALQLLVAGAAWTLSPWRLGRMLRTVSLPRMREHALRTNLTVLGVALGVSVLVAVLLVSRSIVLGATATIEELAGKADLQVLGGASGFDEAVIDKLRALPGVYKLTPVVRQIATARGPNGRRERVLLLGVDLLGKDDSYFRSYPSPELAALRRDPLQFLNSPTNLILSRALAERLGVKLHDEVAIGTGGGMERFRIWGLVDGEGVGAAFGGAVAVMYYPALQVSFGRGRNIDSLDVAVRPGSDPRQVAEALTAALGDGFEIKPPAMRGERVAKMLVTIRVGLTMCSLIAVVAGALLVFNTVTIGISQRKRELGIVRALGAGRRQLVALLTLEGLLLGGVGAAIGVAAGVYMSRTLLALTADVVDQMYLQLAVSKVQIDPPLVAAGFALGVAGATLAARLAAQRAAAIQPAQALSSRVNAGGGPAAAGAEWFGLALLALTIALLQLPNIEGAPLAAEAACMTLPLACYGFMPRLVRIAHRALAVSGRRFFGVEAALATDNLPRELGRTAGAASGLMVAVGLTVGIATLTTSVISSILMWADQNLPGQLFVTSGAAVASMSARNTPLSDAVRAELLAVPGVELARPIRIADGDFRGEPIKISSTELDLFVRHAQLSLIEGEPAAVIEELKRGAVAVSENFARRFGVGPGATIELSARDGARPFRVAGVGLDYTSEVGTVFMDRATYSQHFADDRVDTYELHLRRGADAHAVRRAIDARLGERYDLFVLTNGEFRDHAVGAINGLMSLMHVLELVTLLVAALGLVTAVLANVLDRVREIGVLRALGMLRVQIRKLVTIEATLTGAIGLLGGVTVGVGLGYILLRHVAVGQMGWYLPYELPWRSLAAISAVTLPVSALAGFLPARTAAGLIVSRALEYE